VPVDLLFVVHAIAEFLFELVAADLFFLLAGTAVHVLDDGVGHAVHELLGALLSRFDLVQAILLLLVKHAGILFLGTNVFQALSFTLS